MENKAGIDSGEFNERKTVETLVRDLKKRMIFDAGALSRKDIKDFRGGEIGDWLEGVTFKDEENSDMPVSVSDNEGASCLALEKSDYEPVNNINTEVSKEHLVGLMVLTEAKLLCLEENPLMYIDGDTNEKMETTVLEIIEEVFPNMGKEVETYHREIQEITRAVFADKRKEFSLASIMAKVKIKSTSVAVLMALILAACIVNPGIMAASSASMHAKVFSPVVIADSGEEIQRVSNNQPVIEENIEIEKKVEVEAEKVNTWTSFDSIAENETKDEIDEKVERFLSLENTEKMGKFLSEINPELKSFYELSHVINSYDTNKSESMEECITQSEWYENEKDRFAENDALLFKLDAGVRQFSRITDSFGMAQCVGGAILFNPISEGEIKTPTTMTENPLLRVTMAKQLVPDEVKYGGYDSYYENGYYAKKVHSISDLEANQLFVSWDTETGHTGAVVYVDLDENGNTRVWIVDVNKLNDSKMRIYYVVEDTYVKLLGKSLAVVR